MRDSVHSIAAFRSGLFICVLVSIVSVYSQEPDSQAGRTRQNAEPKEKRKKRIRIPIPNDGRYEGEFHFRSTAPARRQPMNGFGPQWSSNAHLLWDGKLKDKCEVTFYVISSSSYQLELQLTSAPDYGQFCVTLDGEPFVPLVDLYADRVELSKSIQFKKRFLSEGLHKLQFELVGSNPNAKPYRKDRFLLGLDFMQVKDVSPDAKPSLTFHRPRKPAQTSFADFRKFVTKNCQSCHNATKNESKIMLDGLLTMDDLIGDISLVKKMAVALEQHEMPPPESTQPEPTLRNQTARFLRDVISEHLQKNIRLPVVVMRRLNRLEYNNAVVDLLNLKGDLYPLPEKVIRSDATHYNPADGFFPEKIRSGNRALGKFQIERSVLTGVVPFSMDLQAEHGFNNRGEELSISPLLLESFVKLGQSILGSPEFKNYCLDYAAIFELPKVTNSNLDNHADNKKVDASRNEPAIMAQAEQRITRLLRRAFRHPPQDSLIKRYTHFFHDQYRRSRNFEQSMKKVVAAILASPRFLFIHHQKTKSISDEPLDPYELATRLSFFLWNSIPDESLLDLAESGKLSNPQVLATQIHNMLLDRRSESLAQNFARQWLRLDQLITAVPDPARFDEYYSRIGCEYWKFGLQTMIEPLLLFESMMVEDDSILTLIDSDFSYRSDELQSWYSNEKPFENRSIVNRFNTNQQDFIRRELQSKREGGVITTAAVMTMTSSPLRTSPIIRGSWFATVILNQPPPPPPDDIPEIEADDAEFEARGLTLRQRLKQHQENQSCASCHAKIDPLGFALETYDPVGRWRNQYRSGLPINSSGKLFGKYEFKDIVELKKVLIDNPKIFTRAFAEHLLAYALGRQLKITDEPAIDRIVRNTLAADGRFSQLVVEVASSYPFRHKANQDSIAGNKAPSQSSTRLPLKK